MDRVSTWFDRNSRLREALQNPTQGSTATPLESCKTSIFEKIHFKTFNVRLLSNGKRDVPSTSYSPPRRSSHNGVIEKASDQDLDSSLWSQLPQCIILLILACLPVQSLARFRLVCKAWRSLWNEPKFLSLRISLAPEEESWFIFNCQHTTCRRSYVHTVCFNPAENSWQTLNLGPELVSTSTLSKHTGFTVVAASDGLILCAAYDTTLWKFRDGQSYGRRTPSGGHPIEWFVCNPLRENCWLKLPDRPVLPDEPAHSYNDPLFSSAGLIVDNAANSFQVIVGTPHTTEVYSSGSGCWKLLRYRFPRNYAYNSVHTVAYKGFMISLGVSEMKVNQFPNCSTASVYDPEEGQWSRLRLPTLLSTKRILSLQIAACEGRLLLLVIVGPWTNAWSSTSISYNVATPNPFKFEDSVRLFLWEFLGEDLRNGEWREVCSHLVQEIRELAVEVETEEGTKLLAAASGKDLICCTLTDPILSQSVQLLHSPFYNTWFSIQELLADERMCCNIADFFEQSIRFQPKLEAIALPEKSST